MKPTALAPIPPFRGSVAVSIAALMAIIAAIAASGTIYRDVLVITVMASMACIMVIVGAIPKHQSIK